MKRKRAPAPIPLSVVIFDENKLGYTARFTK